MRPRYELRTNYARLWRNRAKRENWQSDFKGKILLQDGVSYFVGATLRTRLDDEDYLAIYLRPDVPILRSKDVLVRKCT